MQPKLFCLLTSCLLFLHTGWTKKKFSKNRYCTLKGNIILQHHWIKHWMKRSHIQVSQIRVQSQLHLSLGTVITWNFYGNILESKVCQDTWIILNNSSFFVVSACVYRDGSPRTFPIFYLDSAPGFRPANNHLQIT